MRDAALGALALFLCAALGGGCATRNVREVAFESKGTKVELRTQKKGTRVVERNFDHPATIAGARLAHILSRIDLRMEAKKGSKRAPAVPTESLYVIADGLSQALSKANSNQEIAVLSIYKTKRFGIFDRKYLTSFVAYVQEDLLYIHFSASDWKIKTRHKNEKLPQPAIGESVMRFRLLPSKAMAQVDSTSLAVDWRDEIFRRPTRTRITGTGRVVRREILMESEQELEDVSNAPTMPEHLSPSTLRDLADAEEGRLKGELSEAEYRARRREILEAAGAPPPRE